MSTPCKPEDGRAVSHYNIKSKLGVSSDIELLYFGLQHGVIAPIAPLPELRK